MMMPVMTLPYSDLGRDMTGTAQKESNRQSNHQ